MSSVLTKGKKKKADEAARAGRFEEARVLYQAVCKVDRADVEAWVKAGETSRRLGDYVEAESCCRRALSLQPRLGFAHYGLGAALQCQGKRMEAIASYRSAIQCQADLPEAHYFLGNALFESGELHDAVASLRHAVVLRANYFSALSDLGAALVALGNDDEAESVLARARSINPDSTEVLGNLGSVSERRGRVEEALQYYRRALGLDPDSLAMAAKLGELLERLNRLDEAEQVIAAGLARTPENPSLILIAARLDRRAGRNENAITKLESALNQSTPLDVAAEMHLLLGQLNDAIGNIDKVFPHLLAGKGLIASATDPHGAARERFLLRAKRTAEVVGQFANRSLSAVEGNFADAPIFVIGFPRSGTTLLEQVLDSHPNLQALDERPMVALMERKVVDWMGDASDSLVRLTDAQVIELRKVYFTEASRYIERRNGSTLVDKLPLNILSVPLIWRVFPEARFVLALRHPFDVCLSCLMQNFGQNDAMAGFTSLPNIAEIYESVLGGWIRCADQLPLRCHPLRYEDLISDFEPQCRSLVDFLGLEWSDAVLEHTAHARARVIKTPSYHQVTQPIYQHAKYRWRRYEKEFEPLGARLNPFIERFGYC